MYFCWGLGQRKCYPPWPAASHHLTGAQSFCGESESAWALTWAGIVVLYLVTNEPSGYLSSTAYSNFLSEGSCTTALMQWGSHSEPCILSIRLAVTGRAEAHIFVFYLYTSSILLIWHGWFYEGLARLKKSYWYWIFFRYLLKNSTGTYTPKNEKVQAFTRGANVTISLIFIYNFHSTILCISLPVFFVLFGYCWILFNSEFWSVTPATILLCISVYWRAAIACFSASF